MLELKSRIVFLKDLPAGAFLGYGGTFRTQRPSRIATVPIGYADGLSRKLSNRGRAIVRDHYVPIVGNISMDLALLDLTEVPGAEVGDVATFIGTSPHCKIGAREIANQLNLWDSERSSLIAKSRFVTLFNQAAKLERSLINFMLDLHVKKGYLEVLPPALVNTASLTGSGQLPKFAEESFRCADDDLWLTPTAEVPLTSLHRGEIIPRELLPLKYVAYSPCFRREAGSYGRDTRGIIRLHQFNKVELYCFSDPEKSTSALDQITADIENSNSLLDSEKSPTLITGYRNINRSEDLVYIFYTTSKIAGLF